MSQTRKSPPPIPATARRVPSWDDVTTVDNTTMADLMTELSARGRVALDAVEVR